MTKEELLKQEILEQYRSLRQFCMKLDIPYSTLSTALERGLDGMAYGTVLKMCNDLSISPIDFSTLEVATSVNEQLYENRIMQRFVKLNKRGRGKIVEMMDDYLELDKYTEK